MKNSARSLLRLKAAAILLLTIGCGEPDNSIASQTSNRNVFSTFNSPAETSRTAKPKVAPKRADLGPNRFSKIHHLKNTDVVWAKNGNCIVENSNRSDFEIVCPAPIKSLEYEFISSEKSLSLHGNIGGRWVDLHVRKAEQNRITGHTADSHIDFFLVLDDGREEIIRID